MKLRVRLDGTLGSREDMEVEIPERRKVKDLLSLLEIPTNIGVVVVVEGRVLKADDELPPESHVDVFQPILGG